MRAAAVTSAGRRKPLKGWRLVLLLAAWVLAGPAHGQLRNGKAAAAPKEKSMADSGFTELYSGAPVAIAAPPVPIRPAAPVAVAPAPVVAGEPFRWYVNDSMNSRAAYSLAAPTLVVEKKAALEPTFGPLYIMKAGSRILVQGIAMQVFTDDLQPVQKITGGFGFSMVYPAKQLAYAGDSQTGLLAAFNLVTGKQAYVVSLIDGYGNQRQWFTRRGNQIFVASLEEMVDPHDVVPEGSSLQVLQLNEPETVNPLGEMESTGINNLLRKAQHLVAASLPGAIVTAFDDHVFLMDWGLKIRIDLQGAFTPVRLSLDETGAIYLAVHEKEEEKRSALWMLRANGGRQMRVLLDSPASALLAPPIIAYDHTVYLLTKNALTAVSDMGEVRWTRPSQSGGFAGAVATPDGHIVVADGAELAAFNSAGERRTVYRAADSLVTPPAVLEGGRVLVASVRTLYLLNAAAQ